MNSLFKQLVVCLLVFVVYSCSEGNEDPELDDNNGSAKFSKSEIIVSASGGKSSAILVWDDAEWQIEVADESIITNISPSSGGESGSSDFTTISITVTENDTENERNTEIYAVNTSTQEKETITIIQEAYPITSVSSGTTYQKVVGFGGMYNPAIWIASEDRISSDELKTMYDSDGQLQYSVLRLMIYADESKWAEDVDGALEAQNYGAIIFASPWDCTVALDDTITVDGEKVKHLPEENYDAYADHLIAYYNYMKSQGVNIYAISVQNEPDMSFTYWTPEEITTFTANYGAKIRAAGVKLMSPEACGYQPAYTDAIINSSEAFANTDIVAGHLYQGFTDLTSSYVESRHDYICELYPNYLSSAGKTWWMTEKLFGSYGDDLQSGDYKKWSYNMDNLALEIHMCMEGYCSAYVYWYLKRFYGMISDNNEYAYENEGTVLKNGYIMGHYSAYATGMTRIKIDSPDDELLMTAYINDAGDEITVVAQNIGDESYITFLELPYEISSAAAIETSENYNAKTVDTTISDDKKHVKIEISSQSIYSIRIVI